MTIEQLVNNLHDIFLDIDSGDWSTEELESLKHTLEYFTNSVECKLSEDI